MRRDACGGTARLGYGLDGELLTVTNERGEVHRFKYSTDGQLVEEDTFDGRRLRYRSDLCGRLVRMENGGGEITVRTYDLAGQLIAVELPDETKETFVYNLCGELVRASGEGGDLAFTRDTVGRIVREAQIVGGIEHWVDVSFDPTGERVVRTTSLGHVEDIERDAMGARVRTVLNGGKQLHYTSDLLAREIQRRLPKGGTIDSTFDSAGRLVERGARAPSGSPVVPSRQPEWIGRRDDGVTALTSYQYDSDDELISQADRSRGQTRYEYDPIGRLVALLPEAARAEVFRYDATSNPFEANVGDANSREYGPGNRLLRRGDTRYDWDHAGRLSAKTTRDAATGVERAWRYHWDGGGLLRAVEEPTGMRAEFSYDPFARRTQKRVSKKSPTTLQWIPLSVTRFVWDGDVLVHEIKAAAQESGDPIVEERTYLFEDGRFVPVAHRTVQRRDSAQGADDEPAKWVHYVNDPVGEPDRLIGEDGIVACAYQRKAWGALVAEEGATADTPIRLQGQYWDEETGLAYNRFRYFDPEVGGFISYDPLGLAAGPNSYAFAPNAYSWTDPLGLIAAPAGLPDEPGIYTITNSITGEAYVGSAGIGKGGMASRLADPDHHWQDLAGKEGTVVTYKKVCLGSAKDPSERNNILRMYEQQEFARTKAKGFTMLNDAPIQSAAKAAATPAVAAAAGASKARNPSTAYP
jgi:RHS repeat-associated protein